MILVWRGAGVLAAVMMFPVAFSAGLATLDPPWLFPLGFPRSLLIAGVVCAWCGTRWNRPVTEHSLYFVPLQVWGWVYLTVSALLGTGFIVGAFRKGLNKPNGLALLAVGAAVVGLTVAAVLMLVLTGRSEPQSDAPDGLNDRAGGGADDEEPRRPWERRR